jgi:hypothetical protein
VVAVHWTIVFAMIMVGIVGGGRLYFLCETEQSPSGRVADVVIIAMVVALEFGLYRYL